MLLLQRTANIRHLPLRRSSPSVQFTSTLSSRHRYRMWIGRMWARRSLESTNYVIKKPQTPPKNPKTICTINNNNVRRFFQYLSVYLRLGDTGASNMASSSESIESSRSWSSWRRLCSRSLRLNACAEEQGEEKKTMYEMLAVVETKTLTNTCKFQIDVINNNANGSKDVATYSLRLVFL